MGGLPATHFFSPPYGVVSDTAKPPHSRLSLHPPTPLLIKRPPRRSEDPAIRGRGDLANLVFWSFDLGERPRSPVQLDEPTTNLGWLITGPDEDRTRLDLLDRTRCGEPLRPWDDLPFPIQPPGDRRLSLLALEHTPDAMLDASAQVCDPLERPSDLGLRTRVNSVPSS